MTQRHVKTTVVQAAMLRDAAAEWQNQSRGGRSGRWKSRIDEDNIFSKDLDILAKATRISCMFVGEKPCAKSCLNYVDGNDCIL